MKKLLVIFALVMLCLPVLAESFGDMVKQKFESHEKWQKVADHIYFNPTSRVVKGSERIGTFKVYFNDTCEVVDYGYDFDSEDDGVAYIVYTVKINANDGIVKIPAAKRFTINNKQVNIGYPSQLNNKPYNTSYLRTKFYNVLYGKNIADDKYDNPYFSRTEMIKIYELSDKIKDAVKNNDMYALANYINYPFGDIQNKAEFIHRYGNTSFSKDFMEHVCNNDIVFDRYMIYLGTGDEIQIDLYPASNDSNNSKNRTPRILDIKFEN